VKSTAPVTDARIPASGEGKGFTTSPVVGQHGLAQQCLGDRRAQPIRQRGHLRSGREGALTGQNGNARAGIQRVGGAAPSLPAVSVIWALCRQSRRCMSATPC
jgi:hypothetical protein